MLEAIGMNDRYKMWIDEVNTILIIISKFKYVSDIS